MKTREPFLCLQTRHASIPYYIVLILSLTIFAHSPRQTIAQDQQSQTAGGQLPEIKLVPVSLEGPIERAEKDGTALRASLKAIIKMALEANLDIAIAETNEDSLQWSLTSAKAAYEPTLSTTNFRWQSGKSLNYNSYEASQSTVLSRLNHSWGTGITQNIPTGGSLTLSISGNRSDTNSGSVMANPSYGSSWSVGFTQPLLRDFKIDAPRNAIRLANLALKGNDTQFKSQVSQTMQTVESQYWRLVQAIESYKISVAAVKAARLTVETNIKKYYIGTIPPIDVVSAQSQQARQEVSLLGAEEGVQREENNLKTLISKDQSADIWGRTIIPTDLPDVSEFVIDFKTALTTAITNSPQLENLDNQLKQLDYTYELNRNSRKWLLSLTGSVSGGGFGVPEGNTNYPAKLWGGLGTSYLYMFNITPPSWSVGVNLNLPLSHKIMDAQLAQTRINREKQIMARAKQEQAIVVSVRNYYQALTTAKKQIDTAEIGTQAADAQMAAVQRRLELGLATNQDWINAQDGVNTARNSLLGAKIGYRLAILNLQQTMFTLLEANNISTGDIAKSSRF
jgi:outer membrane protein